MPLTTTSTVVTEVKTTETVYPTCFIRNAYDPSAYLDHADNQDQNPNQVRVVNIQDAKAWKIDKDNKNNDLLIFSAARGVALTHKLSAILQLDSARTSVRKWHIEKAEAARFRLSGTTFDIENKYWTIDTDTHDVKLEDPVKGTAKLEDKLKQQWVFEPIIIA